MTKTVAEHMAAEAKQLTFADLPPEIVHEAKRHVLDTIGVGFGGYLSEPSRIMQGVVEEIKGPPEATIFCSGRKTSCLNATLANGIMVRYLDFVNRCFLTKEANTNMGHHGEAIPPILAVAERQHASGQEVIATIVLAFEMLNKIADSLGGNYGVLGPHGWSPESVRTPCIMALVAGRLLGLNEEQLANALALAGSYNFELGILISPQEQLTMARNLKFPYGAYAGILGAFMAQKGFKGPLNVFEGHDGIAQVVTGGEMNLEKLVKPRQGWTIQNTYIKRFAANGGTQGLVEAVLSLVKEHDIKAQDVEKIRFAVNTPTYKRHANEARRYPETKFSADHSCFYTTAIAILDRAVGPEQYSDEKLRDPRVRELASKMVAELDTGLDEFVSSANVHITIKNQQTFNCKVLHPKGHPMNPMSDEEIEEKFRRMAGEHVSEKQMQQIIEAVYGLDKLKDIGDFMRLLVIPKH